MKWLYSYTKTNHQQQLYMITFIMFYYFHFPISGIICKTASNNSKSVCYYYDLRSREIVVYIRYKMFMYSV